MMSVEDSYMVLKVLSIDENPGMTELLGLC
jgi:hypothetical protein